MTAPFSHVIYVSSGSMQGETASVCSKAPCILGTLNCRPSSVRKAYKTASIPSLLEVIVNIAMVLLREGRVCLLGP